MGCDYYVSVKLSLTIKRDVAAKQRQVMLRSPGKKYNWTSRGDIPAFNEDGLPIMETYEERTERVYYKDQELKSPDPKLQPWVYVEDSGIKLRLSGEGYNTLCLSMDNYSIGFHDDNYSWPEMEDARKLIVESMKSLFDIDVDEKDVVVSLYESC